MGDEAGPAVLMPARGLDQFFGLGQTDSTVGRRGTVPEPDHRGAVLQELELEARRIARRRRRQRLVTHLDGDLREGHPGPRHPSQIPIEPTLDAGRVLNLHVRDGGTFVRCGEDVDARHAHYLVDGGMQVHGHLAGGRLGSGPREPDRAVIGGVQHA